MKKINKISLKLNKQVIEQLDKNQMSHIKGGGDEVLLSLFGSNCNNSDPNAHPCCTGTPEPVVSYGTVTTTTPGSCCNCGD